MSTFPENSALFSKFRAGSGIDRSGKPPQSSRTVRHQRKSVQKRLSELSELLDFGDLLNRTVGKLSGGQRRRIDIARALLHEPEILILDEPTTGLDPQTRLLLWSVVMQLRAEHGLTVFLTTHYMEEAADADYVVILDSGSIAAEGTPLELKNRFTGDFITLYGVTPEKAAALGEYRVESTRDGIRIAVKNTAEATQLILKHPELFTDYEIKKAEWTMCSLPQRAKSFPEVLNHDRLLQSFYSQLQTFSRIKACSLPR